MSNFLHYKEKIVKFFPEHKKFFSRTGVKRFFWIYSFMLLSLEKNRFLWNSLVIYGIILQELYLEELK